MTIGQSLEVICQCGAPLEADGSCSVEGCVASPKACEHPRAEVRLVDTWLDAGELQVEVICGACGSMGIDCCPVSYPYRFQDMDIAVAFNRACYQCGEPGVSLRRSDGNLCGACI